MQFTILLPSLCRVITARLRAFTVRLPCVFSAVTACAPRGGRVFSAHVLRVQYVLYVYRAFIARMLRACCYVEFTASLSYVYFACTAGLPFIDRAHIACLPCVCSVFITCFLRFNRGSTACFLSFHSVYCVSAAHSLCGGRVFGAHSLGVSCVFVMFLLRVCCTSAV